MYGSMHEVITQYQSQAVFAKAEWRRESYAEDGKDFSFQRITLRNREGQPTSVFRGDEDISVEIRYLVRTKLFDCQIGVRVQHSDGFVVFTTSDADIYHIPALRKEAGSYRTKLTIPGQLLAPGTYSLLVAAHQPNRNVFEVVEEGVVFEILPQGSLTSLDGRLGLLAPLIDWETTKE